MKLEKLNVNELVQLIESAPINEKSQAIVKAVQALLDEKMDDTVLEYQAMAEEYNSNRQSAEKFGLRQLSKQETDFYQKITEGAFTTDQDTLIPTSISNYIYEDLRVARPLFEHIDWTPAGVKKWIIGEKVGKAQWGAIDAKIVDEIKAQLEPFDLEAHKLSAFAMVPQGIIELGFQWVDKFIRESLLEANEEGLAEGFINGNGKNAPIGMMKNIKGAVTDGIYPDAEAKKLTDFSPKGLGEHLVVLSNGGKRNLRKLVVVSNSTDYLTKIAPATTFLAASGEYRKVVPYDIEFVQEPSVPSGKAVLFISKGYSAGISRIAVDATTTYQFLDHVKTYKIVSYGNGRLKQQNMSVVLDITELAPLAFNTTGNGEGA